jgi:hypothetical protein
MSEKSSLDLQTKKMTENSILGSDVEKTRKNNISDVDLLIVRKLVKLLSPNVLMIIRNGLILVYVYIQFRAHLLTVGLILAKRTNHYMLINANYSGTA